ncbi:alkaline shock response membrane anchor protein AmaP [Actinomycetospora atypica]|uniref:Alkaline shock response membrane anchor protein AmaP n=1 Tax=Actinomycetospora atypica TaxID=1290095 RepID=A0ABV9YFW4_9PSEU
MARRATNPPARLNRSLLALVGLLLIAAAVLAAGISTGRLPLLDAGSPILSAPDPLPGWVPWVAAVAGVVVGLLALRWLLAQARRRPAGSAWSVDADGPTPGTTSVPSGVAEDALRDDLVAHPAIADARVRLTRGGPAPTLFVELAVDAGADPAEARAHLGGHALPRLRSALDVGSVPTELLMRTGRAREDERVA